MRVRSLPHFKHAPIGKTSHTKNFSYFHINYIIRESACTKVLAEHMPANREAARSFFEQQAAKEGVAANARIADTFIIALPIELTPEQRYDLVERFMQKIGKGRIAWLAGFHDKSEDAHNPHCHLIFRDTDIDTGRKVVGTTTGAKDVKEAQAKGWQVPPRMTTKDLRVAWCRLVNDDMKRLGIDVRFDERRLKDRGIEREPELHVGRKGHAMAAAGKDAESADRRHGDHVNAYTLVDRGSRHEHNERIKSRNRSSNGEGAGYAASLEEAQQKQELREQQKLQRKDLYADQKRDRAALRQVHRAERREDERVGRVLFAGVRAKAYKETGEAFKERWTAARQIENNRAKRQAMKEIYAEQKRAYSIAAAAEVDKARPEKNARWLAQQAAQTAERETLKGLHGDEQRALARQHVAERHALHERWQQTHLMKDASRISGRLETQQSMAVVQINAIKQIKLRAKQDRGASTGSAEAIAFFTDTARSEAANRAALRATLDRDRDINLGRAAATSQRARAEPGVNAQKRSGLDTQARPSERQAKDRELRAGRASLKGQGPAADRQPTKPPENGGTGRSNDPASSKRRQGDLFSDYRRDRNDSGREGGRSGR